jgi:1-acyl-sn-glycerol-3-phosphate acyltransferase
MLLLAMIKASYNARYRVAKSYACSFIALARIICGLHYKLNGLENLPKGPAVILSNHQSFWENMIMPVLFPMQTWVVKKELLNIPIFGLGLRIADPISIDRTKPSSVNQIFEVGSNKIAQGLWVVIFPEATRLNPGQTVPFKASGVKLAQINNVPIVPMAHNAGVFWPKGFWIKGPGEITIQIGEAIYPGLEHDTKELNAEVEAWINDAKEKLL